MTRADQRGKTMALIQARMGSSRLPGKVLMNLRGYSLLELQLARLRRSRELDEWGIVTSDRPEDDVIAYVAAKNDVPCFRGSAEDVLDRYYQAARTFTARHIVRLTGDCPLVDTEVIDNLVKLYHARGADLAILRGFPDGICGSVVSFAALAAAWAEARLPSEREHVCPWILKRAFINGENLYLARNYPGVDSSKAPTPEGMQLFQAVEYACPEDLSAERWTIDEPADYEFLRELAELPGLSLLDAGLQEIRQALDSHPRLRAINRHILRNEGFRKSVAADQQALAMAQPLARGGLMPGQGESS